MGYKKARVEEEGGKIELIKKEEIAGLEIEENESLRFLLKEENCAFAIVKRGFGSFGKNGAFHLPDIIGYKWEIRQDIENCICLFLRKDEN